MKKALFLLFTLFALTIPAFATAVTVSATQLAGFNPSNIGGDRSITVTATTGSATVTSSAAFPPNIVGFGGFQVRIGGSQYTVSSVTSTSSLTLTANYGGSSGSQTMTLYKWVWFRWYALQSFTPLGNCVQSGVPCTIQPGTPGSGAWYIQMAASVVSNGQSNLLYIPSFTIDSTTDAASTADKYAKYSAAFYRVDNSLIQYYFCSSINQFSIPPTTPTSLVDLCTYNRATPQPPPPPATYYNSAQIDARFASCSQGQGYYFAATGNAVSCLTFGSGLTLTGSTLTASGGGGASNVVQAYNVYVDGGCDKTGATDVTSCVATALAAANSSGRPLYFPAGTYKANITIAGLNSLRIFGDGPGRTIIQSATGASPVIFANNATGLTHSLTIEEISLNGFNSGAADYGFRMSPDQPFDLTMRNVRINDTSDGGVYIPTNAFTMLFDGVDVTVTGGNGFDIFGDNTITFIRTYVHNVGTGGAAYRLRSGRFVLIGANGIDSGTNADWGLFGDTLAEDGVDAYARVTLIGCNVEAFTNNGVRVKAGSQVSVHDTNFVSPGSGTITAIKMDNMSGVNPGVFDGLSGFALNGTAAWTNGAPINSAGVPFLFDGAPNPATYYDTGEAALVNIGYRSNALNGTNDRSTQYFNRIALGASSTEGFDGNMYFVPDDTRTIGNSSPAGRPQHIYVGTGGVHVGTGSVPVEGQNWNVTGGTNPLIEFNNATVAGRFQLLAAGPYMQLGTTSNHAINFLTNNTARWVMNSSGHWIVDSGSLTIGLAAGNRPTIGYFSTSVNVGIPGTGVGSIVFGNGTNSNTFTLQSGATGSSLTFTLPTADGSSGHCLKTNGSGVLSFGSCGGGGGSTVWSDLTDPAGNLSLAMAARTTTFTWGNATGASTNMFTMADTASNSGTGYVLAINTAASSAAKPVRVTAGGTSNGVEMTTAGVLQAIGTGQIQGTATGASGAVQYNNGSNIMGADNGLIYDSLTATLQLGIASTTSGKLLFRNSSNSNTATIATGAPSGNITITLPTVTSTLATLAGTEALTNKSINGMTITASTGTFTLTNNKTFAVQNTLTFSGTDSSSVAFGAGGTVAYVGTANSWSDGIKQTFNPDGTNSGLNVGGHTADPSSPANGDVFYNSTSNKFRCYENGAWTNCITSSSPSLTATRVGYGDGSNLLTGTTDFTYSTSTKTLSVINGSGASTLVLNGSSDTSAVKFGAASLPGSQGGIFFPFVGGGNSSGPGIWWGSSASYATMSGIYLNNGFTFQGANSTHDPVKIAEGTGTSSNGTVRYTFAPSSSLFTQTLSTSVTNVNHDYSIIDLSSTGTAAANFGAGMLVKLENGSSTQVDASRIRTYWTTATAGSETSAVAIGIQKAGGGVADVLTVTGDQYYGIRYTANITGAATIDLNNGNSQELTLTGNVTATTLSNLKAGGIYFIIFKQDGTGSRTLASTNIKAPGGSLTLTATAGARDLFVCTSDGTNLYCNKALDVR